MCIRDRACCAKSLEEGIEVRDLFTVCEGIIRSHVYMYIIIEPSPTFTRLHTARDEDGWRIKSTTIVRGRFYRRKSFRYSSLVEHPFCYESQSHMELYLDEMPKTLCRMSSKRCSADGLFTIIPILHDRIRTTCALQDDVVCCRNHASTQRYSWTLV